MSSRDICSFFYNEAMETNHNLQGDLIDILRAGADDENGNFLKSTEVSTANCNELSSIANGSSSSSSCSSQEIKPFSPLPPTIKLRKGQQAKRVICVPDQGGGGGGSSGVVAPSDLWAWRKYGQKPIKGSPYPRSYYRCSSSKGCSAKKQVERSRSDPSMLVITYTSEHNHVWPTTTKASLAGSSKSHHSKIHSSKKKRSTNSKQEEQDIGPSSFSIKEEEALNLEHVFDQSYEPLTMLDFKDMEFFSELGGFDPDPMSSLFSSNNKSVDPLSYFDWDGN